MAGFHVIGRIALNKNNNSYYNNNTTIAIIIDNNNWYQDILDLSEVSSLR